MNLPAKSSIAALALMAALTSTVSAADLTANNCEIFISKVFSAPGSHGTGSLGVVVKTGWIGNGEYIEDVKFYGRTTYTDLGNRSDCHSGPWSGHGGWDYRSAVQDSYYASQWGEYLFRLPIQSGSVDSRCPGYHYNWIGTFFVQTNKNTYWLNPDLNPDTNFYLDNNAFDLIARKGGNFSPVSTLRPDLTYYNPKQCQ